MWQGIKAKSGYDNNQLNKTLNKIEQETDKDFKFSSDNTKKETPEDIKNEYETKKAELELLTNNAVNNSDDVKSKKQNEEFVKFKAIVSHVEAKKKEMEKNRKNDNMKSIKYFDEYYLEKNELSEQKNF